MAKAMKTSLIVILRELIHCLQSLDESLFKNNVCKFYTDWMPQGVHEEANTKTVHRNVVIGFYGHGLGVNRNN